MYVFENFNTFYAEIDATYDDRKPGTRFLGPATPSSGWRINAFFGYTRTFAKPDDKSYGRVGLFSWLGHTDLKEDDWLDMWVEDPERPGQHYVRHFLLDFGKALGAMHYLERSEEDGYAYGFDWGYTIPSLFAFGLWRRPWEGIEYPRMLGLADFDAEHFDPGRWRPRTPVMAFWRRDHTDDFWAAKILMRLS